MTRIPKQNPSKYPLQIFLLGKTKDNEESKFSSSQKIRGEANITANQFIISFNNRTLNIPEDIMEWEAHLNYKELSPPVIYIKTKTESFFIKTIELEFVNLLLSKLSGKEQISITPKPQPPPLIHLLLTSVTFWLLLLLAITRSFTYLFYSIIPLIGILTFITQEYNYRQTYKKWFTEEVKRFSTLLNSSD